jgi:alpha/beta superfamily hydrolase
VTLGELDDVSKPDPDHGEQRVSFFGDHELEGKLGWPGVPLDGVRSQPVREIRGGVVVAHPYPPNGGNMDLPLMYRIAKECRRHRFASLRFNFRSVGASSGSFSGTEEDRDVAAAVEFMAGQLATAGEQTGAILPQGLAGWSFGSVMAARAAAELAEVQALALVGFPIHWEQLPADTLERLAGYRGSVLAVCAENDHHGTPDEVERELSGLGLNLKIEVVRDADHYLMGSEQKVGRLVADFFDVALAR